MTTNQLSYIIYARIFIYFQFWVAFTGCESNYKDAVALTMSQIDVIKRLIKKYPDDLMYVTDSDGIMKAFSEKKIASLISVEGGHSIDSRMSVLRLYYELGVRYMTLTHNCNLPWLVHNTHKQICILSMRRSILNLI